MLSYILRLSFDFERQHGYWPNMLYLSMEQFRNWQREFHEDTDFDEISRRLNMEIIISVDALHPHVAWLSHRRYACVS